MAKGKAIGRFEATLGVVGVLALATTYILITGWNPLPTLRTGFDKWLANTGKLAEPEATWVQRVGGQPDAAVLAGNATVITMQGMIEARGLRSGDVLWHRDADWAAVAGDESGTVAVVGRRGAGLEVLDPDSGTARWKDASAVGAWTYRDAVLTLTCDGLSDCSLASRAPRDGAVRWKATLPGIGRVFAGVNAELLGSRELSGTYRDAIAAIPVPLPADLGFPIDQRVQVVDTATGKRLRQEAPSSTTRIVVVGGRIIVSTALPKDGGCRYSLEARDVTSGKSVWKKEGYDLRTASGVGCEQRHDPAGGGGVLIATRGDNREVFLSATDGREIWVGAPGETILSTDGRYGLVRSASKNTLKVYSMGSAEMQWQQQVPVKSDIAITRYAVLVSDPATTQLRAFEPTNGRQLVDVKTGGEVLGSGPTGLMLGRGRTIGFLPYGTTSSR